jgi:hypothetical protein
MIIEKSSQFCVRQSRAVSANVVPLRSILPRSGSQRAVASQSASQSARARDQAEPQTWQPVGDVVGGILRSLAHANKKTGT